MSTFFSRLQSGDIGPALKRAKEIESLLEETFNIRDGHGLGQKARMVKHILPRNIWYSIEYVSKIRNQLAHDKKINKLPNKKEYYSHCNKIEKYLRSQQKKGCFGGFFGTLLKLGAAGLLLLLVVSLLMGFKYTDSSKQKGNIYRSIPELNK